MGKKKSSCRLVGRRELDEALGGLSLQLCQSLNEQLHELIDRSLARLKSEVLQQETTRLSSSSNVDRRSQYRFSRELKSDTLIPNDVVAEAVEREIEAPGEEGDGWADVGGFWEHHGLKVPVPTDEDGGKRMKVMVRDRLNQPWQPATLLGVNHRDNCGHFVVINQYGNTDTFAQCRLLGPNE